jgi:hypothetical protein
LINIQRGENPVNHRFPQNFQMISTSGIFAERERESCQPKTNRSRFLTIRPFGMTWLFSDGAHDNTQPYGLPIGDNATFGARRYGRQEIEKRSFGGPCFEGTLRKAFTYGQLLSESSPVAGTIENFKPLSRILDAGRDREFHKYDRLSHTSALGELFIADQCKKAQGGI